MREIFQSSVFGAISMKKELYLPTLSHWEHGNTWSGEWGNTRFCIVPADGQMTAEVWPGPMARDFSEVTAAETFSIGTDGIEALRGWLLDQAAKIEQNIVN